MPVKRGHFQPQRVVLALLCFLVLASCIAVSASPPDAAAGESQHCVKIIFDTDIGGDIDDALALAILHDAQDKKLCKILAITITNSEPNAGGYTKIFNRLCGRPNIPIGINPNTIRFHEDPKKRFYSRLVQHTPEAQEKFPPALAVLRRTLAAAPDKSVVIVQTGFSSNLAALLNSKPDEISPLEGRTLVVQKVRYLSIMGGAFNNAFDNPNTSESNIRNDIPAARAVAKNWPTPRVWNGFEIGQAIRFPAIAIAYFLPADNLLRESYQYFLPVPHERPCWDLTSVFFTINPLTPYLTQSRSGNVVVDERGVTSFHPDPAGLDSILSVTPEQARFLRQQFADIIVGKFHSPKDAQMPSLPHAKFIAQRLKAKLNLFENPSALEIINKDFFNHLLSTRSDTPFEKPFHSWIDVSTPEKLAGWTGALDDKNPIGLYALAQQDAIGKWRILAVQMPFREHITRLDWKLKFRDLWHFYFVLNDSKNSSSSLSTESKLRLLGYSFHTGKIYEIPITPKPAVVQQPPLSTNNNPNNKK